MGIGDILLLLVNGGAIIYSAARSYHVISSTLPPEMQIVGLIALAVTEVALVGWEFYYLTSAKCARQKGIALLMFFAQLVCVFALVAGDTWMVVDPEAAPATITMAVLWAVPVILVVNMGALFCVHALNPAAKIAQAQLDVQFEIDEQAAKQLRQSKAQIAAEVSGEGARHYANETKAQYLRSFSGNGKGATATYQKTALDFGKHFAIESSYSAKAWQEKWAATYPNDKPEWGEVEEGASYTLNEASHMVANFHALPINAGYLFRIVDKRNNTVITQDQEPQTAEPLPGKAPRPRSRAS